MRREYHRLELVEGQAESNPLVQFRRWFDDACAAEVLEPNAMVVATVDADCRPSQRSVLLKHFDESGFVFYTNYESRKGRELAANPNVALLFLWAGMERQVRINGTARHLPALQSDEYFAERPRGSQIGSISSPQSQVIPDRQWLSDRYEAFAKRAEEDGALARPGHWGGILVEPTEYEFWQGRPNRLHDRLRYRCDAGAWIIERLAP